MTEINQNSNDLSASDGSAQKKPITPKLKKYIPKEDKNILSSKILNPLWLSVSETAKIAGITTKTVRRAIQSHKVIYKVVMDRYLIDLRSSLLFVFSNKKLKNKLTQKGIGQYIDKWKN
jgi:hypothetical protein